MSGKTLRSSCAAAAVVAAGALTAAGLAGTTASATVAPPGSGCAQVHVIAARASTESPGAGIIGSLVSLVQNQSRQTVSTDSVDYPALLFPYPESSAAGTAALKKQLTDQVAKCPNQKVVLVGYSQGAHIIGDVLGGGGGGLLGAKTPAISTSIGDKVAAVIQMGDPRHIVNQSYDVGTSRRNGLFPREADQSLSHYASKIQSYCDSGDTFCDSGLDTAVHLSYTVRYNTAATNFVLNRIGG